VLDGLSERVESGTVRGGQGAAVTRCTQPPPAARESGDRVFLFGFSRGAFTVRSRGGVLMRSTYEAERRKRSDVSGPTNIRGKGHDMDDWPDGFICALSGAASRPP
jgi:hypothetical protein